MFPATPSDGFALAPGVLGAAERADLLARLDPVDGAGRRGLLDVPEVAALAGSARLLALVQPHLPETPDGPRPVRAIFFDKSPAANWAVLWHQDLTLALRAWAETPGFGPWSVKDGVPHVQPPVALLERMLTVRLHLDDADEGNGALRVLPGTHVLGRLSAGRVRELRAERTAVLCRAAAGDALLMRPLLLHASGRSVDGARRRRVLHVEYAAFALPGGLAWHEGRTA